MSDFEKQPATPLAVPPDPTKHVNYAMGMVLGVDDFTQEFAYLSGRDQWLTRELLGYGTVCGLHVAIENDGVKGPRVAVSAGTAVSPQGQLITVPNAQCASVDDWLNARKSDLDTVLSPSSMSVTLYVVLSYRSCPTDPVPIPGEPCRSEDELMAPSRLADDFQLELRAEIPGQPGMPDQREEDALRDFVLWLRQVTVINTGPSVPLSDFLQTLRAAMQQWVPSPPDSPPSSPPGDFMVGSPPASLQINAVDLAAYMRAAFLLWVTEFRPLWLGKNQTCSMPPDEGGVLLAELSVPLVNELSGERRVDPARDIEVNEERRPFLLHLPMLQEWLLAGLEPRPDGSIVLPSEAIRRLGTGPSYDVVAAGVLQGNQTAAGPVIGGLRVASVASGEVVFVFDNYREPDGSFQYIVKVLPVSAPPRTPVPTVRFLEFRSTGFVLKVTRGTINVSVTDLRAVQFMLEVSRIG